MTNPISILTPAATLALWVTKYSTIDLDMAHDAMTDYIAGCGNPLLNLFMIPSSNALASDITNVLMKMSILEIHRFMNLLEIHVEKAIEGCSA